MEKADKPGKIRTPFIGCLAMIGIVLMSEAAVPGQRTDRKGRGPEGFGELGWGTSIERSTEIHQDLHFDKYVISNSKEEPWKVYVRRGEHGEIEDVAFDSVEYWFKGDHFCLVRAVLHSRIGPRTLVTRAENAFDKITGKLKERYGNPSEHKVDYVTEFIVVVKETTWVVDRSAITVKYEGAGRTNEDLLTLTIRERPKR